MKKCKKLLASSMAAGLMAIPYEKSFADTVIENLAVDVLHHSNTKDSNNRSL